MIPVILLGAVLAVGALGVCAMVVTLNRHLAKRRRRREQLAARAARVRETARIHAAHAAQRAARAAAAPAPRPIAFDDGSLTGVFRALEQTGPFAVARPPMPPPARAARGTTSPPIRRPAVPPPIPRAGGRGRVRT